MPKVPPGAKVPNDHKKSAVQIEAEGGEHVTVNWREFSFEILADPDDWPVSATIAFEEGKVMSGVSGLLGPKQWAELMATKPRNRDVGDLFDCIAKATGMESPGE